MHPYSPSLEITECFDEVPGWLAWPKNVPGWEKLSALAYKLCAPQQVMDTSPAPGDAPTCLEVIVRVRPR